MKREGKRNELDRREHERSFSLLKKWVCTLKKKVYARAFC